MIMLLNLCREQDILPQRVREEAAVMIIVIFVLGSSTFLSPFDFRGISKYNRFPDISPSSFCHIPYLEGSYHLTFLHALNNDLTLLELTPKIRP